MSGIRDWKGLIDRFEDTIVVIEVDGKCVDYPLSSVPSTAKVGDVIVFHNGEFTIDQAATTKRRADIEELMQDLFED